MDRELLLSTGLNQSELGKLFGVSRITINAWIHGRFTPHHLHKTAVLDIANRLAAATKEGKLPLPIGLGKPARVAEARRIIGLTD